MLSGIATGHNILRQIGLMTALSEREIAERQKILVESHIVVDILH